MKESPKLSASTRRRLLVVFVLSVLGVAAFAAVYPAVVIGPVGGSLAGY